MSKVYSFRLDDNNPREAQAREVLKAWAIKGYSLRQIIVDVVLSQSAENVSIHGVDKLIEKLELLLEKFDKRSVPPESDTMSKGSLNSEFIEAISKAIKPGQNLLNSK